MIDFLILANGEPYELGVYENMILKEKFQMCAKAATALPTLIQSALKRCGKPDRILYAAGPGNLTSLKLSYVCAKTVAIAKNAEFLGTSSFNFNDGNPIAAFGKKSFELCEKEIKLSDKIGCALSLPISIENIEFISEHPPIYPLPSVS